MRGASLPGDRPSPPGPSRRKRGRGGNARAMQTVPTGLAGEPPVGPAMPEMANAKGGFGEAAGVFGHGFDDDFADGRR